MVEPDWAAYVQEFHRERAGITEDVLEHAVDERGATPYDWLAAAVPAGAAVDLACGSAPMAARLPGCVGLDLSAAELRAAAARGVAVARADVTRLPLPDQCVDAVVMSMALMLVPLPPTLAEVRRVLRPGGMLVATVPHNRPLPLGDWLRYARLCLALRHPGLSYPNDDALAAAPAQLAAAGLRLLEDDVTAFRCQITDEHVADQLLASLYLPDVPEQRRGAGIRVVRRWVGRSITAPIRRLVAEAP